MDRAFVGAFLVVAGSWVFSLHLVHGHVPGMLTAFMAIVGGCFLACRRPR